MSWLWLTVALAAQAPELEEYFDRQAPAADRIDAIDLAFTDRIVRFPRRTDAVALTLAGGVVSSSAPPVRSMRWFVWAGFAIAFDAFLIPAPLGAAAPPLERERWARCLAIQGRTHREREARAAALGCAS